MTKRATSVKTSTLTQRARREKQPVIGKRAGHRKSPGDDQRVEDILNDGTPIVRVDHELVPNGRAKGVKAPKEPKRAITDKQPAEEQRAAKMKPTTQSQRAISKEQLTTTERAAQRPLPNRRHERFAQLVAAGNSATEAYLEVFNETITSRDAAAAASSRLLSDVKVRSRVTFLSTTILGNAISAASVTKEKVLTELARVGYANMLDYMRIDGEGMPVIDVSNLTREQAAAIQEFNIETTTRRGRSEDDEPEVVTKIKFKLHPKVPALTELGRHLQLFTDNANVILTEDPALVERRERGIRLLQALLEEKARGRLPASIGSILGEYAGRGKVIEGEVR